VPCGNAGARIAAIGEGGGCATGHSSRLLELLTGSANVNETAFPIDRREKKILLAMAVFKRSLILILFRADHARSIGQVFAKLSGESGLISLGGVMGSKILSETCSEAECSGAHHRVRGGEDSSTIGPRARFDGTGRGASPEPDEGGAGLSPSLA
jgi:hypothetical protein